MGAGVDCGFCAVFYEVVVAGLEHLVELICAVPEYRASIGDRICSRVDSTAKIINLNRTANIIGNQIDITKQRIATPQLISPWILPDNSGIDIIAPAPIVGEIEEHVHGDICCGVAGDKCCGC